MKRIYLAAVIETLLNVHRSFGETFMNDRRQYWALFEFLPPIGALGQQKGSGQQEWGLGGGLGGVRR